MTTKRAFAISRLDAPEVCINLSPQGGRGECRVPAAPAAFPKEGVGNAGCPLHPQPRVHFVLVERTRVTTSTPESPGIPARNGFTTYFVLSPVTGLVCHRRPRIGFV